LGTVDLRAKGKRQEKILNEINRPGQQKWHKLSCQEGLNGKGGKENYI
jgi:hypothetical protein